MKNDARTLALIGGAAVVEVVLLLNVLLPLEGEEDSAGWYFGLMGFPIAAAIILAHRPDNGVGRALGAVTVTIGVMFVCAWYGVTYQSGPLSRLVEAAGSAIVVLNFLSFVALLHLFPTGRPIDGWPRRTFYIFIGLGIACALTLQPASLPLSERPNPLSLGASDGVSNLAFLVLVPFSVLGVVSLFMRWRSSGQTERAQLKWFFGAGVTVMVMFLLLATVMGGEDEGGVVDDVSSMFIVLAFWALPTAIVVAVTRYRLYDIDRVISRTLTYGVLTAGLATTYFGLVVGLQALLRPLSDGSDFAIVATTLIVAALFLPARRRIQDAVDRRFNRRAYDAARTVNAFSARLREQVDLDTLHEELLGVVIETMQPKEASLWLRVEETRR